MLTTDIVRQLLDYDPATGVFTWREREGSAGLDGGFNQKYAGTQAGRSSKSKYDSIAIYGKRFYAHRIAWLYVTGKLPVDLIDHVNGDTRDNRFVNLREATSPENGWNSRPHKRNKYGLKGIARLDGRYKNANFRAMIKVRGKMVYLGYFDTAEEAHAAYANAARKYHGEFARLS